MLIRVFIVCILASYTVVNLQAQSNWIEWKEDVSEAEEMSGWQEQYEFLVSILFSAMTILSAVFQPIK